MAAPAAQQTDADLLDQMVAQAADLMRLAHARAKDPANQFGDAVKTFCDLSTCLRRAILLRDRLRTAKPVRLAPPRTADVPRPHAATRPAARAPPADLGAERLDRVPRDLPAFLKQATATLDRARTVLAKLPARPAPKLAPQPAPPFAAAWPAPAPTTRAALLGSTAAARAPPR